MHYKQIYVCLCRRSNCSSNLFLRSEPHVRTFAWLKKNGGKWDRIYCGLPNEVYVHLVFSYSLLAIITIEWGSLYIDYMRNRERGTQVTEPKLNGLSPNIQWIRFLGLNIIWHHTIAPQFSLVECREGSGDWIYSEVRWAWGDKPHPWRLDEALQLELRSLGPNEAFKA